MATRRQVHIAVAHQHDYDGCKVCYDKFGEAAGGRDGALKMASRSGASTPARSDSRRRSMPTPSALFKTGAHPALPRFPRSLSDPNTIHTMSSSLDDAVSLAFKKTHSPQHTYVFSADVHPATSPRTHHHHNASLTPSQLAAHAFGPPAKGYDFGDEGGVRPWPDCEQDTSSSAAGVIQSEDRKKRRKSYLRYDVLQSADVDEIRMPSPIMTLSSLGQQSEASSSSSVAPAAESSPLPGSCPCLGTSEDRAKLSTVPAVMDSRPTPSVSVLSSAPGSASQVSVRSKKRKRPSFRFRSSYHPLMRSEMLSPPASCSSTASSTPSLLHSSPTLSATSTASSSKLPTMSSSPVNLQHELRPGSLADPPLTISELDFFGAIATRELVDWGPPPPASISETKRTWRRSSRAPLPPRIRRLQNLLQLEQASGVACVEPMALDGQPALLPSSPPSALTNEDVEMQICS